MLGSYGIRRPKSLQSGRWHRRRLVGPLCSRSDAMWRTRTGMATSGNLIPGSIVGLICWLCDSDTDEATAERRALVWVPEFTSTKSHLHVRREHRQRLLSGIIQLSVPRVECRDSRTAWRSRTEAEVARHCDRTCSVVPSCASSASGRLDDRHTDGPSRRSQPSVAGARVEATSSRPDHAHQNDRPRWPYPSSSPTVAHL